MKRYPVSVLLILQMLMAGCGWLVNTDLPPEDPPWGTSETNTDPNNISIRGLDNKLLSVGVHDGQLSPLGPLAQRIGGFSNDTRYVDTDTNPPRITHAIFGAKPCVETEDGENCTGHFVGAFAFEGCLRDFSSSLAETECHWNSQSGDLSMVSDAYTSVFLFFGKIEEDVDNLGQYILTTYVSDTTNPAQAQLFESEGRVFFQWEFDDAVYPGGTDAPNPAAPTDVLSDVPFETEFFQGSPMGPGGVDAGPLGTSYCALGDDLQAYAFPDSIGFGGQDIASYVICP